MPLGTSHPYTIQLPQFEGPLDVLLRLIEQEKLAITALSLAQVADQYLAHVRALTAPDPQLVAEFLALAAQLLLIKSRALLPQPDAPSSETADDGAEHLAQRLREYQQFKAVATHLRAWEVAGQRTWERSVPPPATIAIADLPPQRIETMLHAIQRRLQMLHEQPTPIIAVPRPKVISIAEVAAVLQDRLSQQDWISFEDVLSLSTTRSEVIVTLWTVLELFKRGLIRVEQPDLFEPIALGRGTAFDQWLSSDVPLVDQHTGAGSESNGSPSAYP